MSDVITVHCPSCETEFPVDTAKIPAGGVNARCSVCREIFRVEEPSARAPDETGAGEADEFGDVALEGSNEAYLSGPETTEAETDAGAEMEAAAEAEATFALDEKPETAEIEQEVEVDTVDYFFEGAPPAVEEEEGGEEVPPAREPEEGEEVPPAREPEEGEGGGEPPVADEAPAVETSRPVFGQRSPEQKAERLARVLISDMITYNPELYNAARERGTLAEDFQDEIQKSWEEYVDQVGDELAESTPYWKDALNEILAEGQDLF